MKKDLLIILIAAVAVTFLILGTKVQSVDDYYLTHLDVITEDSETVFMSIECGAILNNWNDLDANLRYEKYVPPDGMILPKGGDEKAVSAEGYETLKIEYVLRKGDTVFDILVRAARHNKIQMEHQDAPLNAFNSAYVKGINQLYEFSCGPLSGWAYSVNKVVQDRGCSAYKLSDGDVIEWKYTCDLGRDI